MPFLPPNQQRQSTEGTVSLKKMSIWSRIYQHSVFKRYHSNKRFSEFYQQDGGKNQLA